MSLPMAVFNDLEGRLVGAPFMAKTAGFDPGLCRLTPLQLRVLRRCVFISFNPDAPSFDKFIEPFEVDFGERVHPERCRLGFRIAIDVDCNWKLLTEKLMDMYHVGMLHAGIFGAGTVVDTANVYLRPRGGMRVDYRSHPMVPGGASPFGQISWLADDAPSFATMGFIQPNTHLVVRSDNLLFLVSWPLAPGRCQSILYCLFPEEFFSDPVFTEKIETYQKFTHQVTNEDREMVRSLQRAMSVRGYAPGQLARLEKPIHHVINGLLDRIFAT